MIVTEVLAFDDNLTLSLGSYCSTKAFGRARLPIGMRTFALMRTIRLLLATSVSVWMAGGGCMLGCSTSAQAMVRNSEVPQHSTSHSSVGKSCHGSKNKKPTAQHLRPGSYSFQTSVFLTAQTPQTSTECPLGVDSTAAGAKSSGSLAERDLTIVEIPARTEIRSAAILLRSSHLHLPNRGPTYLRCCVFLI
jgi:hypothetical protein